MEYRPPEPAWLFYVLSFIEPVAGIVIGAIFLGKQTEVCRDFGKVCLFTVVARFAITVVFIMAVVIIYLAVGLTLFAIPISTGY
ncbi:MAG: hypothetical protein JSW52_08180 [Candidatus Coatesbacteria bacterium]|nr:MAG: hypothetical protein JSW52_08180 [Candidatus Coatesbacteria bacterium]